MICMICNRKLKDPVSIQLGVGPVCRKKIGLNAKVMQEIKDQGLDGEPVLGGIRLLLIPDDHERGTVE